jgi:hypothetical protein
VVEVVAPVQRVVAAEERRETPVTFEPFRSRLRPDYVADGMSERRFEAVLLRRA